MSYIRYVLFSLTLFACLLFFLFEFSKNNIEVTAVRRECGTTYCY